MPKELEAKFAVESLEDVRLRLEATATLKKGWRFERNAVFDTPDRSLKSRGDLLRLRHVDGEAVLTWKTPAQEAAHSGIKAMEEVETRVENFESTRTILQGLGYEEALLYEKCREVWTLEQAVVCLDILPFGEFVEIEGDPEVIAWAARTLGLDMTHAKALTYHDLHQQYLAKLGLPPADSFLFHDKDKDRLKALCHIP